jgi:hypothetical protein
LQRARYREADARDPVHRAKNEPLGNQKREGLTSVSAPPFILKSPMPPECMAKDLRISQSLM